MASCPKSKTLAVGTANGCCIFMSCKSSEEWQPLGESLKELSSQFDYVVMSLDILLRGSHTNLFVVGYSHGMVRLYTSDDPKCIVEV